MRLFLKKIETVVIKICLVSHIVVGNEIVCCKEINPGVGK